MIIEARDLCCCRRGQGQDSDDDGTHGVLPYSPTQPGKRPATPLPDDPEADARSSKAFFARMIRPRDAE